MLMKNEIIDGNFYAWDLIGMVSEPQVGCNLFTIIEKDKDGLLIVESIDGCITQKIGSHCLITAEKALKRLEVLRKIDIPTDTMGKWSYDRELKYLSNFESAYLAHQISKDIEKQNMADKQNENDQIGKHYDE